MCASLPTGAAEGCGDRGSVEEVSVIHRLNVDEVVGPVVRRGHVREAREVGRRGRAEVAVRGQELRLWEPRAGDDTGDAPLGGDPSRRNKSHPDRSWRHHFPPCRKPPFPGVAIPLSDLPLSFPLFHSPGWVC